MSPVSVSFVVPVFNSRRTLDACLASIFSCAYPAGGFEVIVVDNGSTDNSAEIAEGHGAKLESKIGGTISSVRNRGAEVARGEVLAFVDSDCVIADDWLLEAVAVLAEASVGATGSGYLPPDDYTWVEKAWLYEGERGVFKTSLLPGGNLLIKADVFRAIGGFDETLTTGEDADICIRIIRAGYDIINSSKIRCVHLGNSKTLRQFVRKEFWYGAGMMRGLTATQLDRTLVMTLIYVACMVFFATGVVGFFLGGTASLMGYPLLCMLSVALISSGYRVRRSRKYRYFFHIGLLYFLYFVSRSCAVVNSVYKGLRNA